MREDTIIIDFFGRERISRLLLLGKILGQYGINSLIIDMTESGRFENLLIDGTQTKGITELDGCFYLSWADMTMMNADELEKELAEKRVKVVLRNMAGLPSLVGYGHEVFNKAGIALISVSEDIVDLDNAWTGRLQGYDRIILVCDGYTGYKPALIRLRKLAKELREGCSDVSICTVRNTSASQKIELQAQFMGKVSVNSVPGDEGDVLDMLLSYVGESDKNQKGAGST